MKDKFLEQKDVLTSLKHEISLLHQQIDYLLRNGKSLGLLDLDVMMNRTHTIYDQLCSIDLSENDASYEEETVDTEAINALFGLSEEPAPVEEEESVPEEIESVPEEIESVPEEEEPVSEEEEPLPVAEEVEPLPVEEEKPEEINFDFNLTAEDPEVVEPIPVEEEEPLPVEEEEPLPEEEEEPVPVEESAPLPIEEPLPVEEEEPLPVEEEKPEEIAFDFNLTAEDPEVVEPQPETPQPEETDYGFIFKMEPLDTTDEPLETSVEPEETVVETPEPLEEPVESLEEPKEPEEESYQPRPNTEQTYTTGDQIELEIPHFDFPTNPDDEAEFPEAPIYPEEEDEFEEEEIPEEKRDDEDFQYEPVIFGDMAEKDDAGFEFETHETHETLGEKLHVRTLRSAIGINDKFLLVNELFGGSMEKYNRSIENLDDVKTLNGALIYMNELRIDLQWNSNNEAYKKLLELVHRKFED